MKPGEEFALKLMAEFAAWTAARPVHISPAENALAFYCQRLQGDVRRAFTLAAASRISAYVDSAVSVVAELALGDANAFSHAVDELFDQLQKSSRLAEPELLRRYAAMRQDGAIGNAFGGQGDSLVEELLTEAMNLLRAVLSDDGLILSLHDEEGNPYEAMSTGFASAVCRIANSMLDPHKFPDTDETGIPPWALASLELDAQWMTVEIFSQATADARSDIARAAQYSLKCRAQNLRLIESGRERFRMELAKSWERYLRVRGSA